MATIWVIALYLGALLAFAMASRVFFRGTSADYFVASRSIGPFMLLMSVFGTTMTAFALVGSTGKAFERGIGTYGLMASSSGLVHAACFFLIGIRLWAIGKRHGYVTQIQFFRARFESNALGYLLFPILVLLVIPYLLIGVIGAGKTLQPATAGTFPNTFPDPSPILNGGVPPWLSGLVICLVVLAYIFAGGSRAAAWANTFQTLVFMLMGLIAFIFIVSVLGKAGNPNEVVARVTADGKVVQEYAFDKERGTVVKAAEPREVARLVHPGEAAAWEGRQPHLARDVVETEFKVRKGDGPPVYDDEEPQLREVGVPWLMFLTYMFIPLSVGMFPHLFQHWLTARSARAFRLTVIAHPICIMIVWVPCVLIGTWATGLLPWGIPPGAVLSNVLKTLIDNPILTGMLTAGILAAIMSSLDSQFLCLGTIFTNDIVLHNSKRQFTDQQILLMARGFVVAIVALTYVLSLVLYEKNVFDLAVWCFSGFAALTPLVLAALYWRRATTAGAFASVLTVAVTWFVFFALSGFGGEYTLPGGIMPVALCWLAGALAMIAVSLATKPPSEETVAMFFQ